MKKYPSGKNINEITDNLTIQINEGGIDTSALANARAGGIDVRQETPESVYKNLSIFRRLLKNIPVGMEQLTVFTEKLKGQEDELKQKESSFYEEFDKGESKGKELTATKIPTSSEKSQKIDNEMEQFYAEMEQYLDNVEKNIIEHNTNVDTLKKDLEEKDKEIRKILKDKTITKPIRDGAINKIKKEKIQIETEIEDELIKLEKDAINEEKKKYLKDRVDKLKHLNLNQRITIKEIKSGYFKDYDPYQSRFLFQVPTIDGELPSENRDNVIFEGYIDKNGEYKKYDIPITKNGEELENHDLYDLDKYVKIASVSKGGRNKNGEVVKSNIESKYRYTDEQLRNFIGERELPELYENINLDEDYDPRKPEYHIIPSHGFGLTNNIIKHFNKDNKDMEKLSKSLKKHLKVEEKVDGAKKKGGAVDFSAKRIKIGKGLSPMEKEPIHKEFD